MLVNSHRFVRATMALEAVPVGTAPVNEEFLVFARDVEKTLEQLAKALGGEKVVARHLPDLREDHHRLVDSANSETLCVNNSETSSPSTITVGAEKDSHLHEQDQW